MNRGRRLAWVGALVLATACSRPQASQVLVQLGADEVVQSMANSYRVTVRGRGRDDPDFGALSFSRVLTSDELSDPGSAVVALAPVGQDETRLFRVELEAFSGLNAEGRSLLSTYAISGYVRHETRKLPLTLRGSCIAAECDPTTTCRRDASCEDPFIPPERLAPADGSGDGGATDSGAIDSGTVDSGVVDSGAIDSGVVDSGVVDSGVDAGPCAAGCDDGNPCTEDTCDVSSGCRHRPRGGPCDDGIFCNGPDACSPTGGSCSIHRNPDGNGPCTGTATCEEATDRCLCGSAGAGTCFVTETCAVGVCRCLGLNEVPGNGVDDDCDFLVDEAIDGGEICDNYVDDDFDGAVDCGDSDCRGVQDTRGNSFCSP